LRPLTFFGSAKFEVFQEKPPFSVSPLYVRNKVKRQFYRCICNKHFEGDYCERIICYHGYPNIKNMSLSCICPAKYKGLHCDQCSQVGPKIQPYPICTVNYIPSHARQSRKKTHQQIKYRFVIMTGAVTFLVVIAVSMCAFHIWHQRRKNPEEEAVRMAALSERSQMLADAALHPESEVQTTITKKERRRSLTNPFRLKRSASADRGVPRFKGKEYSDNFIIEKN
ncbi:hypothetical protein ANCCAN_04275, partial [Ancylostoma caninum]